jgi:YesN/AraC family two-component response regulator
MFKTLIVEDSFIFRKLLKEILHTRFPSMEITEAMDGGEALQEIGASHPDLIFMDIKLPGQNGLDLAKLIKTKYPDTVIVILTSYDIPEYREAALQNSADHFLSKGSSTKAEILALVDSILSKQQSLTEKEPN